MSPRHVVILAPRLATLQDVTGPWEVFCRAEAKAGGGAYRVEMVATGPDRRVETKFGLEIACARTLAELDEQPDTVLAAGGHRSHEPGSEPDLALWLAKAAGRVRRLGSVCTGAFHLAEAGLLDGRRATTHWAYCDRLAERFPKARVEADPIFVKDGVYTSAGITAGIDLALALVEEDHGAALAHEVARELVVFLRRPADQAQISAALARQLSGRRSIRELLAWLPDHLDADLGVETLARLVNMSLRSFTRAFRQETGATPAAHVAALRLEAAKARLGQGGSSLEEVARGAGFGSLKTMDRLFLKTLGVTAARYRTGISNDR